MKRVMTCLVVLLLWVGAWPSWAHLGTPASLVIQETSLRQFTVEFKLPIVEGRVLKARPVLPDVCVLQGESAVRSTASTVMRSWEMECEPRALVGTPLGVTGLLGTAQDVQLTVAFLDGRTHVATLRPTRSFYVVPPSPSLLELTRHAGREGIRRIVRNPELVLLVVAAALSGMRWHALLIGILAFALAHGAGQLLGERAGMVVTPFLPRALIAWTAWLAALAATRRKPGGSPSSGRWGWPVGALIGVLAGGSLTETVLPPGLSQVQQPVGLALFSLGMALGAGIVALAAWQLRSVIASALPAASHRVEDLALFAVGVIALGWGTYQASAIAIVGTVAPSLPLVSLAACAVLAFCCRQQGDTDLQRTLLTLLGGVAFAGAAVAAHRAGLSVNTLWVLGSLALMGALVAWGRSWPRWVTIPLLVTVALVHGVNAAAMLIDAGSSRPADVVATLVLLALVPFACYATADRLRPEAVLTLARAAGLTALGLALLYRLSEYWEWMAGPLAADATMGLIRIPVLAGILLLWCLVAVPRKPRFSGEAKRGLSWPRWALLLGLAIFLVPHGTVRLSNPFFTPSPPSSAAAKRILSTVLSDIYQAFNLPDEGDAFDALATSISQELIADVYLDSRRRLTAGTRKGAEVHIKDVGVIFVGDAIPGGADDDSFTYPCQWYVTARVTHWQHTHDRRNTYAGELTIRVEGNRWKIARLDLESEEREVLSWKSS
jgi:hypothetical protein